jgi:hypothetical protein
VGVAKRNLGVTDEDLRNLMGIVEGEGLAGVQVQPDGRTGLRVQAHSQLGAQTQLRCASAVRRPAGVGSQVLGVHLLLVGDHVITRTLVELVL